MIWGALVGGLVGTVVLTTLLRTASELGLTRMDLPFLLGTGVTDDRLRAKAIGYALHFGFGLVFALGYYAIFAVLNESGVLLGALLGLVHGLFAEVRWSTSCSHSSTPGWLPASRQPEKRRCSSRLAFCCVTTADGRP
jgi:hypothetical protein